jgi:hypothetical protein
VDHITHEGIQERLYTVFIELVSAAVFMVSAVRCIMEALEMSLAYK